MRTLNRQALTRSLLLCVATVLALVCSFTSTSAGLLKAFVSMGNTFTDADYDLPSLILPHSVPSFLAVTKYTNRRHLLADLIILLLLTRHSSGGSQGPDGKDTCGDVAEICTKSDISIFQGEVNPLPNGIPTFSVQILNLCPVGCSVSNIHVACGWFASAKLINPLVFRRMSFNDCLVNDGNPLDGGDILSFEYSNSFEYPMRVEAAVICNHP